MLLCTVGCKSCPHCVFLATERASDSSFMKGKTLCYVSCDISQEAPEGARASVQSSALHLGFYALLVVWLVEVLGNFCVALASPSAAQSQPGLCSWHGLWLNTAACWLRSEEWRCGRAQKLPLYNCHRWNNP